MFFEIDSTATFTPPVTVCISYPADWESIPSLLDGLRLWHAEGDVYREVPTTLDLVNDRICGEVSSLSPFALATKDAAGAGLVPPDRPAGTCSRTVAKAAAKLAQGIAACDVRAAGLALRGLPTGESECESAVRAKYDATMARVTGCSPCTPVAAPALGDAVTAELAAVHGMIHCAGAASPGNPFTRVPPDAASAACSKRRSKSATTYLASIIKCRTKAADKALVGAAFDEAGCRGNADARYAALDDDGCPSCLVDAVETVHTRLGAAAGRWIGDSHCGGTAPLPEP